MRDSTKGILATVAGVGVIAGVAWLGRRMRTLGDLGVSIHVPGRKPVELPTKGKVNFKISYDYAEDQASAFNLAWLTGQNEWDINFLEGPTFAEISRDLKTAIQEIVKSGRDDMEIVIRSGMKKVAKAPTESATRREEGAERGPKKLTGQDQYDDWKAGMSAKDMEKKYGTGISTIKKNMKVYSIANELKWPVDRPGQG